ncbi:MAG: hypothetical protein R2873_34575 [Caldilineaceae bacterium]
MLALSQGLPHYCREVFRPFLIFLIIVSLKDPEQCFQIPEKPQRDDECETNHLLHPSGINPGIIREINVVIHTISFERNNTPLPEQPIPIRYDSITSFA